jgi:NAD(P)H-hydrate epimerase
MRHAKLSEDLYAAADVRAIDQAAIQEFGLPGIDLMERAGAGAFAALRQRWPEARTLSAICGGGNNGGDGYVVARLAHEQGFDVRVFPLSPSDSLKGDAGLAWQRYRDAGGAVLDFIPEDFEATEILVDALFGTGLDREVTGAAAEVIRAVNRYRDRGRTHRPDRRAVVALDIASGLQADSGACLGPAIRADLTVTFVALKRGLFTGDGPEQSGEVILDDLGIPPRARQATRPSARLWKPPEPALPRRTRSAHKGLYGHVLVVGGDHGYSGAARLAGEAAARVGAGLVSVATRPEHASVLNLTRPELMCRGVDHPFDLERLLEQASVVAIGPGLGRSDWAQAFWAQVIDTGLPLVVDADALNLLAKTPVRRGDWVRTPHPGEAARLLGVNNAAIQRDRFAAVQELQSRYGGVAVLKGAGTLIQAEGEQPTVCTAGNPGMASGGMGDVLTGVIAGLIAQKLELPDAASLGVWLHAAAGDRAARDGERGLLASDLMPHLRALANG